VVFLDACHSAAAGKDRRGSPREVAFKNFKEGTGSWLLASSAKDQVSRGHEALGHGFFSYAMIEGIRDGKAAGGDRLITVLELAQYATETVPVLSLVNAKVPQYPNCLVRRIRTWFWGGPTSSR